MESILGPKEAVLTGDQVDLRRIAAKLRARDVKLPRCSEVCLVALKNVGER